MTLAPKRARGSTWPPRRKGDWLRVIEVPVPLSSRPADPRRSFCGPTESWHTPSTVARRSTPSRRTRRPSSAPAKGDVQVFVVDGSAIDRRKAGGLLEQEGNLSEPKEAPGCRGETGTGSESSRCLSPFRRGPRPRAEAFADPLNSRLHGQRSRGVRRHRGGPAGRHPPRPRAMSRCSWWTVRPSTVERPVASWSGRAT
jgi:hypothetical protein